MSFNRTAVCGFAAAIITSLALATAQAQQVPNTFSSGETASAQEVNENFGSIVNTLGTLDTSVSDIETDVSDLQGRVTDLENAPATERRTITIPAHAMGGVGETEQNDGLSLPGNPSGEALYASLQQPVDYAGGDVEFKIGFKTEDDSTGTVIPFSRARSFMSGQNYSDTTGVVFPSTQVTGADIVYVTSTTVPESRVSEQMWYLNIQRSPTESYTGGVTILYLSIEYDAVVNNGS